MSWCSHSLRSVVACGSLLAAALSAGAPVTAEGRLRADAGGFRNAAGQRVAFFGVNLFQSHLMWSRRQNPAEVDAALRAIAGHGFNAVRMPLNLAWFEPAPGIFPDHPDYEAVLKAHGLPTGAVAFYDGLVQRAGELGLYVIPEFHELPVDPYRWFVGGEEKDRGSDRPGRAIAWMGVPDATRKGRYRLDPETAAREVPRALGWLAAHWRNVPTIAGIEIPWNEPTGPLTEGNAFAALCQACARAVKEADPARLVFMDCVDYGAMVNRMPPESLWRVPAEIDALFPHFYPGMHSTDSGADGTWSTTMANWASWLTGSGKPVLVGEYGVVEMRRARYWQDGVSEVQRAATYAACAAQWYAMGVQGIFAWAWDGGIGRDPATGALTQGAAELSKWAAPFTTTVPAADAARVAVVCSAKRRSQYGARKDLWRVTEALLGAHLTPFATLFDDQVLAQPQALARFAALLVLDADLPAGLPALIQAAAKPTYHIAADLNGLEAAVNRLRDLVQPEGATLPANVIVAYADRQATVFERQGKAGNVRLCLRLPGAAGAGRLVDGDGEAVFTGEAAMLERDALSLPLGPWQCRVLRWQPDDAGR